MAFIATSLSSSLLAFVLLAAWCALGTSADIDISQLNVNNIQSQLPAEFANTNFTMEDAKLLVKDKCIQVAGEEKGAEAYAEIETATMTLGECLTGIVNYTALQAEIEEASPKGELDAVFHRYCLKRDAALECIDDFNAKLVPCLDKDERENQDVFLRIIRSLLSFVCHKGGDQIALFIAEKGPECLESKKDDIQQCINSTFSGYMPEEGIENVKTLPKFVLGEKQCDDMSRLEKCVVEKLEQCAEITPANIVESMFRFIKNETICREKSNSAPAMLSLNVATFGAMFAAFYALSKRLAV